MNEELSLQDHLQVNRCRACSSEYHACSQVYLHLRFTYIRFMMSHSLSLPPTHSKYYLVVA